MAKREGSRKPGLSDTESHFLVTLWRLQKERGDGGVPASRVAIEMSIWWRTQHPAASPKENPYQDSDGEPKLGMIRRLVSNLKRDDRKNEGYVIPLKGEEPDGNVVDGYGLVENFMIRRPRAAKILLLLRTFKDDPERPGEKNIATFGEHLRSLGILEAHIKEDLTYAINRGYLIAYPDARRPAHASLAVRFHFEILFLKKLAEFATSSSPKASS